MSSKYIIVMPNVFYGYKNLTKIFDLKGSFRNRYVDDVEHDDDDDDVNHLDHHNDNDNNNNNLTPAEEEEEEGEESKKKKKKKKKKKNPVLLDQNLMKYNHGLVFLYMNFLKIY